MVTAIIESNHSNTTSRDFATPSPSVHFHTEAETEDAITKIDEEHIEIQDPPNTGLLD